MLPTVLAITHTLTMYYVFSGLAMKGLISVYRVGAVRGFYIASKML